MTLQRTDRILSGSRLPWLRRPFPRRHPPGFYPEAQDLRRYAHPRPFGSQVDGLYPSTLVKSNLRLRSRPMVYTPSGGNIRLPVGSRTPKIYHNPPNRAIPINLPPKMPQNHLAFSTISRHTTGRTGPPVVSTVSRPSSPQSDTSTRPPAKTVAEPGRDKRVPPRSSQNPVAASCDPPVSTAEGTQFIVSDDAQTSIRKTDTRFHCGAFRREIPHQSHPKSRRI